MKTITIDGIEYVKKEDIDNNPKEKLNIVALTDESTVMGMGSCNVGPDWVACRISMEYLERAIKSLNSISCSKKLDEVEIAISKNNPFCIGNIKDNRFAGIMIAPRINQEE